MFSWKEKCVIRIASSAKTSQTHGARLRQLFCLHRHLGQLCPSSRPGMRRRAAGAASPQRFPKLYWGRPGNPAQPLSSLPEAGDQIKRFPSSPMFLLSLIINQSVCLLSCHGVFKCGRGHEFQKQTAWHLFPMKSHQKEAKRQSISNISVSFPRRVRSVLGHRRASVRALPVSRREGTCPRAGRSYSWF